MRSHMLQTDEANKDHEPSATTENTTKHNKTCKKLTPSIKDIDHEFKT